MAAGETVIPTDLGGGLLSRIAVAAVRSHADNVLEKLALFAQSADGS